MPMAQFNSHLSVESDQYDITTVTNIHTHNKSSYYYLIYSYKRVDSSILDNHVQSHRWLQKSVSLYIFHLPTNMSCFGILYCYR